MALCRSLTQENVPSQNCMGEKRYQKIIAKIVESCPRTKSKGIIKSTKIWTFHVVYASNKVDMSQWTEVLYFLLESALILFLSKESTKIALKNEFFILFMRLA